MQCERCAFPNGAFRLSCERCGRPLHTVREHAVAVMVVAAVLAALLILLLP